MNSKKDSYTEIKEKGLSINPIIVWFERSAATSSNMMNKHFSHIDPVFDDIILDAYLYINGSEEILLSPIKYSKYGVVKRNGQDVTYEMTSIARKQLQHLSNISHEQWDEITQIQLEV